MTVIYKGHSVASAEHHERKRDYLRERIERAEQERDEAAERAVRVLHSFPGFIEGNLEAALRIVRRQAEHVVGLRLVLEAVSRVEAQEQAAIQRDHDAHAEYQRRLDADEVPTAELAAAFKRLARTLFPPINGSTRPWSHDEIKARGRECAERDLLRDDQLRLIRAVERDRELDARIDCRYLLRAYDHAMATRKAG